MYYLVRPRKKRSIFILFCGRNCSAQQLFAASACLSNAIKNQPGTWIDGDRRSVSHSGPRDQHINTEIPVPLCQDTKQIKKKRCYFEALQQPTVIRRISPRFHEHAASLLAMPCSCSCSPRTQRLPARARTVSHAHALWQQPARNETLPRPAQQLQRRDAGCTALRSPTSGT